MSFADDVRTSYDKVTAVMDSIPVVNLLSPLQKAYGAALVSAGIMAAVPAYAEEAKEPTEVTVTVDTYNPAKIILEKGTLGVDVEPAEPDKKKEPMSPVEVIKEYGTLGM